MQILNNLFNRGILMALLLLIVFVFYPVTILGYGDAPPPPPPPPPHRIGLGVFITPSSCALPLAPPTASIDQSLEITNPGQPFNITWGSSADAYSCVVEKKSPGDSFYVWSLQVPLKSTSGTAVSSPFTLGIHEWKNTCDGPGGTSLVATLSHLVESPPFDYTLSNSGASNVIKTSGDASTTTTITKTLTSGVTEPVTITASGYPSGVTYNVSDQGCSPTCTSVITFTVSPSAPVGTYTITVTGAPLGKQTTFNLVISGNPMSVVCSASPATAILGQLVTWTAVVSGGIPPFTYSWSGTNIPTSPAPNTNPFSIIYSTIGLKTATVTVTDTDSVQATCLNGTVWINFDPTLEEF